jgi:DnaJ like chaperone protein
MSEFLSLWQRILIRFEELRRAAFDPKPPTDTVAFSISFIALSAKLAKADGIVTRDEVTMFRRIFDIPPAEEANAARVYNLCRQETTGFEEYARKLARVVRNDPMGHSVLEDVLDGLFHIAMADGEYHPNEDAYLREVTRIFGIGEEIYEDLKHRHVPEYRNPYRILGVDRDDSWEDIRKARSDFLMANHPDALHVHGLPTEMVGLANVRLSDFNDAFEEIKRRRFPGSGSVGDA